MNLIAEQIETYKSIIETEGDTLLVNMGPQHPSTHGVLRLVLKLKGEEVVKIEPVIGYLHRGFEKLSENLTYIQIVPLTDRMDYLASITNELAYVLTIEKALKIEVPKKAIYLRVLTAELQRIVSHLVWLGTFGLDLGGALGGGSTLFLYCFREREIILDLFEEFSGARMMYNFNQIGGLRYQPPLDFFSKLKATLPKLKQAFAEYEEMLQENYVFKVRTKNIGVLEVSLAQRMGASGPVLRGSGLAYDIRKAYPYSGYENFEFEIPIGENGDCFDRAKVRILEMKQSLRIIQQALKGMPEGEVAIRPPVRVPTAVKVPAGETYMHIEAPRGDLGVFLVSDGTEKPYRLKWRAPSFSNLAVLPFISNGHKVADVMAILGSLDPVFGEVDR
ncbi:MAG: NADH-quinone oxidoreductase subunit D [candidate division Zixibacteria bacterium RBG-1]|nr:MAG: NADH-quinone oxidoreductase subunit D [candidate division Zixibacteria bacterium RBG-1]OGC85610.1 MAG: NADH dehydrogenase [candidate division Zixibacteria bacterium RBG_19FT_COMBO_42_43]